MASVTHADEQLAFEKFYEHSPDALVVVDETGRIANVNMQAEALFGFPRERMLGQSVEMLLPRRFRERHLAHVSVT